MSELTFERRSDSDETPYSHPELFGMETVAVIQWGEASYYFDLTAVLRRLSDGTLWYASDSGCSCPSPFEDVFTWERLFNLDPLSPQGKEYKPPDVREYRDFLAKVNEAFAKLRHCGASHPLFGGACVLEPGHPGQHSKEAR